MKTIHKGDKPAQKRKYPYLGLSRNTESIILFTEPSQGVIVRQGTGFPLGHTSKGWFEGDFEIMQGVLELSND